MIYHLALPEDWAAALAEEGFVHASHDLDQVRRVYAAGYADLSGLLLLAIDESRLTASVRLESPSNTDERFPHVYGPIPVEAVTQVRPYP